MGRLNGTSDRYVGRLWRAVRTEWAALSGFSRTALVGVLLSALLAISLGFMIPSAARDHLVDARLDMLRSVAEDLNDDQLLPSTADESIDIEALDEAVRLRLIGGETLRVKLWSPSGVVVYSDEVALIGSTFDLERGALAAFAGEAVAVEADLSELENEHERGLGPLLEYYLPVNSSSGETVAVFEVYQSPDSLIEAVGNIRRNVWISISVGLGALCLFSVSFTIGNARVINQRRREAEHLVSSLIRAEDDERDRIVGSLHDDVGQPLYRVLYGLQGSRARAEPDSPLDNELAKLETLVRAVDTTLRSELRLLHHPAIADVKLSEALAELVRVTRAETGLSIGLDVVNGASGEIGHVAKSALYRTAAEALTNVRKHADATHAAVKVQVGSGRVRLDVHDNGRGYEGGDGLGLAKARERLEALGGYLVVTGIAGRGTTLSCELPVAPGGTS